MESREDWGPTITIEVYDKVKKPEGDVKGEKKSFHVHKGLLTHHSDYFDNQFSGRWANKTTIEFESSDIKTFQAFYQYLYSHRVAPNPNRTVKKDSKSRMTALLESTKTASLDDKPAQDDNKAANKTPTYSHEELCKMYVLGDFLVCPGFRSAAMDALCDHVAQTWEFPQDIIQVIYENTVASCGLRRFAADFFSKAPVTWKIIFGEYGHTLHREFVIDVVLVLQGMVHDGKEHFPRYHDDWKKIDKCLYHDHEHSEKAAKEGEDGGSA